MPYGTNKGGKTAIAILRLVGCHNKLMPNINGQSRLSSIFYIFLYAAAREEELLIFVRFGVRFPIMYEGLHIFRGRMNLDAITLPQRFYD
jgi:hypothetical protein